jgi:hypothetical protein
MRKTFDCVELQHRGGERLTRKLRTMTREEQLEYFARRTEELRQLQAKLRAEETAPVE